MYIGSTYTNPWFGNITNPTVVGYPIIEIISSGITNGKDLSFATIDFDTTVDDPTARVRIIYGSLGEKINTDKTDTLPVIPRQLMIRKFSLVSSLPGSQEWPRTAVTGKWQFWPNWPKYRKTWCIWQMGFMAR